MNEQEEIHELRREFESCRRDVGEKMLVLERDSIERLARLQSSVEQVEKRIPEWITRVEFTPVKIFTYGLVCIVMTSVMTALMALVVAGGVK